MGSLSVREAIDLSKCLKQDNLRFLTLDYGLREKASELSNRLYSAIMNRLGYVDGNERESFIQRIFSRDGITEYSFSEVAFGDCDYFFDNIFRDLGDSQRVKDFACLFACELGVLSHAYGKGRDQALDEIVDTIEEFNYFDCYDEELDFEMPSPEEFRQYCDELLRSQEFVFAASCGESVEDDEFADDVIAEIAAFYELPDMDVTCKLLPCLLSLLYRLDEEGISLVFFMSKDMGEYHKWRVNNPEESGEIVEALDRALLILESPFDMDCENVDGCLSKYMGGWYVYSLMVFHSDAESVYTPMLATAKAIFSVLYSEFSQQISGRE